MRWWWRGEMVMKGGGGGIGGEVIKKTSKELCILIHTREETEKNHCLIYLIYPAVNPK